MPQGNCCCSILCSTELHSSLQLSRVRKGHCRRCSCPEHPSMQLTRMRKGHRRRYPCSTKIYPSLHFFRMPQRNCCCSILRSTELHPSLQLSRVRKGHRRRCPFSTKIYPSLHFFRMPQGNCCCSILCSTELHPSLQLSRMWEGHRRRCTCPEHPSLYFFRMPKEGCFPKHLRLNFKWSNLQQCFPKLRSWKQERRNRTCQVPSRTWMATRGWRCRLSKEPQGHRD